VAVPAYINHIYRTREATGYQMLLDVQTAQEKYYALNDEYAPAENDAELVSLLGFNPDPLDPGNTAFNKYYKLTMPTPGTTTTYTARIAADLNQDGNYTKCWDVNPPPAQPVQAIGGTCTDTEGFKMSLIANLF
jgi:Tfp pilus assembly protein PilE